MFYFSCSSSFLFPTYRIIYLKYIKNTCLAHIINTSHSTEYFLDVFVLRKQPYSDILKHTFHFTLGPTLLSCIMLSVICPLTIEFSSANHGQIFQEDSVTLTEQCSDIFWAQM